MNKKSSKMGWFIFFLIVILCVSIIAIHAIEPIRYRIIENGPRNYTVERGRFWGLYWEKDTYITPWQEEYESRYETPEEAERVFLLRFEKEPPNKIVKTVTKKGG